jgi:hypothetical protein
MTLLSMIGLALTSAATGLTFDIKTVMSQSPDAVRGYDPPFTGDTWLRHISDTAVRDAGDTGVLRTDGQRFFTSCIPFLILLLY